MVGPWSAFFDIASPQPTDNSRRVWSVGKPTIERPLLDLDRPAAGCYMLNGRSVLSFPEDQTKEEICRAFEDLRAANPGKRILLVLDNFSSHICQYTRKRATQLGIDLVFLPVGSAHLNPIEQVWKTLKWLISPIRVDSKDSFRTLVDETFFEITQRISFASDWIDRFLNVQRLS